MAFSDQIVTCIHTVLHKKSYPPTFTNNFNSSCPIPVIFGIVPSKGGLIFHLTCLVYMPYRGKFETLKIMNLSSKCTYFQC